MTYIGKTNWRPAILAVLLCMALVSWPIYAQLQQSGGPGSTVTANIGTTNGLALNATLTDGTQRAVLNAGSAVIGHVIVDTAPTTAVTGTFFQATQPVSGTVQTVPKTACGTTVASQALAAVPTSATAVFSSTTCLQVILLNNTTSSALTVTVSDNAGTPINDVLTFSIPAFSQLIQPLWGVAFTSGVKWSASGAGVTGGAIGYQ